MKNSIKHQVILEAYACKLVPPDCYPDKCDYGLPIFVLNRTDAVNEAVRMLNHLNIRLTDGIIRYIGKYDVTAGALIAPRRSEIWESNLLEALEALVKKEGEVSHETQK